MERPEPVVQPKKPESPSPGMLRKKHRMHGLQPICRVCCDKAVAHNFDVVSCESCKTFFRRNAYKRQKECSFEGKCEITINTRRFCPACRLKKCFDLGMKAEMILDEAGRKARMEKIEENRKKRKLEAASKEEESTSSSTSESRTGTQKSECDSSGSDLELGSQCPSNSDVPDDFPDLLSSELPEIPDLLEVGSTSPDRQPQLVSDQGQGQGQGEGQRQTVPNGCVSYRRGFPACFEPVPAALLPSDPQMFWRLTDEEQTLYTQLNTDYKEMLLGMPYSPEALEQQFGDMSLNCSFEKLENFAANLVSFVKRVPDFLTLNAHDQVAAVKGSGMRCLLLKSAACFSEERDMWIKAEGVVTELALVHATKLPDKIKQYAEFCRTLKHILKDDYTAFALLTMVVLFEPQSACLHDRQMVNTLYDKYNIYMKHHLESQYSYMFSPQYIESLWDCLHNSKLMAAEMLVVFHTWKDIVGPLITEVLELR